MTTGEGNGTPLQYSCLENPMDGGAWKAAVHGVAGSRTQLSDFTFTFHFHALEKEMATHSSVLAWRIPGTEEPSGLPSMGLHRVGHDWSDLAVAAAAAAMWLLGSTLMLWIWKISDHLPTTSSGFPGGSDGEESACNAGDLDLICGLGREWHPTPVFLPGKPHRERSLEGYSSLSS